MTSASHEAEAQVAATQHHVADFEEANELFHRKGWTDGLPVIPPTAERVARFLETAGLRGDEQIGFYEERRIPVLAEKLAINAVMAGCLPEHFPVVLAIMEGMLAPGFPTHVVNTSTGSFTLGFIVNGPIRHELGMNCHGNVLGPGNRANSSIGRAIRLIQLNVMASVPGAGDSTPEHGRAVLDRSMMGQPAKYTGYHIVENEEAFPSLRPVHTELGFAPEDSAVTVLFTAGYQWICAHAEQSPRDWIDTMAHYIVGSGKLVREGYAALLLPPENAHLFARAGWTKADIREALYERTRRSLAWVKSEGWKVQMQRERLEPVQPGDDDIHLSMAGSSSPEDIHVVVCGGPAGSWPYYLYGTGGPSKAVTRKIGERRLRAPLSAPQSPIVEAVAPLTAMLAADGYDLHLREEGPQKLIARIKPLSGACADCLVPKSMMQVYLEDALKPVCKTAMPELRIVYPNEPD